MAVDDGELDRAPQHPSQERTEVIDDLHEIHRLAVQRQAPTEQHQLLREVRTTHHCVEKIDETVSLLASRGHDAAEPVRAAIDDREQVVEVVCDAARKDTHRLHFLCVPQLSFDHLVLGPVAHDHHPGKNARVNNRVIHDFSRKRRSVASRLTGRRAPLLGWIRPVHGADRLALLRWKERRPLELAKLRLRETVEPDGGGVRSDDAKVGHVHHDNGIRIRLEERPVAKLGGA